MKDIGYLAHRVYIQHTGSFHHLWQVYTGPQLVAEVWWKWCDQGWERPGA